MIRVESPTSAKRQTEQALHESEALINSIFKNVPVGLLIKNSDHLIERANDTYLSWYGFNTDTIAGRRSEEIEDFQSTEEAEFMIAQEREVLTTGLTQTRQVDRLFTDGQIHTIDITKFPVYGQQGKIIKVGSVSIDLTDQVQTQKALAHNEMRFRDFAEAASDWFWEMDECLRFTYFSERTRAITGFDSSNYIGKTRPEITPENTNNEKWRQHYSDLENHRPFRDFSYDLIGADGSWLTIIINGKPVFNENGTFRGYRGTGTDITNLKRAEATSQRLAAAIEPLSESVAIYDVDDQLVFWNEAYCKHHEGELEKLLKPGLKLEDLVRARAYSGEAPEAIGREEAYVADRMERHRNPGKQFETSRKDRWFIYRESPTPDGGTIIIIIDITERKQVEESLRKSEERFRILVEHAPEAITMLDVDTGLYVDANPMAETLHGLPREELIGKIGPKNLSPEIQLDGRPSSEAASDYLSRALAGEFPRFEWMHLTPDGQEILCEVSLTRLPDPHRNLVRASIFDITERKQAEEELKESQARLANILDNSPAPIYFKDTKGRFLVANKQYQKLYDVDFEDIKDKTSKEIFGGDLGKMFFAHDQEVLNTRKAIEREESISGKTYLTLKFPIIDPTGELLGLGGVETDITDRKRDEEALRESEKQFRDFAESASDWFWEMDSELRFTYHSNRYFEITGLRPADKIGTKRTRYSSPSDPEDTADQWDAHMVDLEARRPFKNFEYSFTTPKGDVFHVRISGKPFFDETGKFRGYRGTGTDITEQRAAEEERKKLDQLLLQTQKLESLGQLASGVAHEFNNMLVPVVGMTELVIEDLPEDSQAVENLRLVLEGANRARDLVRKILAFGRTHERSIEKVALDKILEEAVDMLRTTFPSTIKISTDVTVPDVTVLCDPTEIHQVIMNFGTNASHAMEDDQGNLEISLEVVEFKTADGAGDKDPGSRAFAKLTVRDDGCGMDQKTTEKVFDPFFTTKEVGEGTGLGLSVVHGIITAYGGSIEVESELGKGTTFKVFIPIPSESELAAHVDDEPGDGQVPRYGLQPR